MPHIMVDEKTLSDLEAVARARGLTIEGYLRSLVEQSEAKPSSSFSGVEFERELDGLTTDGPRLPPDFSRADIYAEHD
jgi:hypothetical protein